MGTAASVCACADESNPIVSLVSRCTNPLKTSVRDVDDDGNQLLGESMEDADDVRVKNAQTPVGIWYRIGTACGDGTVCSDVFTCTNQSLKDEKPAPAANTAHNARGKRPTGARTGALASLFSAGDNFDLTKVHPFDPPFLGSENGHASPMGSKAPEEFLVFDADCCYAEACTPNRITARSLSDTPESLRSMLTSTTVSSADANGIYDYQLSTPVRTAELKPELAAPNQSRELAITSNELASTVNTGTKGNHVIHASQVPLTPKRLFLVKEDEEDNGQYDESKATPVFSTPRRSPRRTPRRSPPHQTMMTPERIMTPQTLCGMSNHKSCAKVTSSPEEHNKSLFYNGVLINGVPETPERYGPHNNEAQKEVRSSLPSQIPGRPIRLRLTDTTKCEENKTEESDEWSISSSDYFSFRTPFFSSFEFAVTTPSGRPWGNGIVARMEDTNRIQVEDGDGNVLAMMRNAHTIVPSHIIYGSKPRYPGQRARSYRSDTRGVVSSQDISFESLASSNVEEDNFVQYYPWALVKKDGRLRCDSVSIHMAISEQQEEAKNSRVTANPLKGFSHSPSFRGQHGFDGNGDHSHTLVSRFHQRGGEGTDEIGTPCCLIFPSPVKDGVFDITIAPGIDPVLVICYVTLHVRMDSEPNGLPQVHY